MGGAEVTPPRIEGGGPAGDLSSPTHEVGVKGDSEREPCSYCVNADPRKLMYIIITLQSTCLKISLLLLHLEDKVAS